LTPPFPVITQIAGKNYWGSAAGPLRTVAVIMPEACDQNSGVTIFKPFATTGFGVAVLH
jgi:hypothetical protein